MRADLLYVWEHWEDENLENSAAVVALSKYMQGQLNRESTVEDLKRHISEHFESPDFSDASGGLPGSAWEQRVRGYPSFLFDDHKILSVCYFHRDGKFVYAKLRMDRPKSSQDLRAINLTPWVDLFDLLPKPNREQDDDSRASAYLESKQ
ncbi:MAG: hypothetical protein R3F19_35110 [Verrucomicrobiales bacterium]|nr:hypothetical protein [Verrucomicrobiae bacterium]